MQKNENLMQNPRKQGTTNDGTAQKTTMFHYNEFVP